MKKIVDTNIDTRQNLIKVLHKTAGVLFILAVYCCFVLLTGIYIPCPFYTITGFKCPGCGISHMFISLLKLDFAAAFSYNPCIFILLPFIALLLGAYIFSYIKKGSGKLPKPLNILCYIIVFLLIVFGVFRNI